MLKLDSFLLKKQQKLVDFLCSLYIAGFICYSEALYVFPLSGFTTAASLFPGVGLRLFLLWLRRLKSSRIKGDFFFSFLFFSVAEKDFQHRFFFAGSTFCSLQRNPLFQSQGSWRHMLSPRQIWGGGAWTEILLSGSSNPLNQTLGCDCFMMLVLHAERSARFRGTQSASASAGAGLLLGPALSSACSEWKCPRLPRRRRHSVASNSRTTEPANRISPWAPLLVIKLKTHTVSWWLFQHHENGGLLWQVN